MVLSVVREGTKRFSPTHLGRSYLSSVGLPPLSPTAICILASVPPTVSLSFCGHGFVFRISRFVVKFLNFIQVDDNNNE
jgi:membrane protein YqaA with SNARE-associated domain